LSLTGDMRGEATLRGGKDDEVAALAASNEAEAEAEAEDEVSDGVSFIGKGTDSA